MCAYKEQLFETKKQGIKMELVKNRMAIAGRVFGVERKMSQGGKKYQVGSIGVSKKNQDGTYENGFLRFTLFGETPIENKQDYTLHGAMQPMKYTKNDGTAVDSFEMVAYEVYGVKEYEGGNNGGGATQQAPQQKEEPQASPW